MRSAFIRVVQNQTFLPVFVSCLWTDFSEFGTQISDFLSGVQYKYDSYIPKIQ